MIKKRSYLVEWALFAMQVCKACFADCVGTSQIDGRAILGIKFMATHWARQEFGPLWRLDGHPQQEIILDLLGIRFYCKNITKIHKKVRTM